MRKFRSLIVVAILATCAVVMNGCAKPTENNSTTMPLDDVRFNYGGELLARDSAQGVTLDVYRTKDETGVVIAAYVVPDSCVVFLIGDDGQLQAVTKPMSSFTKCLIRGTNVCEHLHDQSTDPEGFARCVGKVILQCGVLSGIFSWFCE